MESSPTSPDPAPGNTVNDIFPAPALVGLATSEDADDEPAAKAIAALKSNAWSSQLISFRDPSILRASKISHLLQSLGAIFRNSAGSAETYKLSTPVQHIDYFISHNWVVGRFSKFLVLAFHFNFNLAVSLALVFSGGSCALIATGWFPTFVPSREEENALEKPWDAYLNVKVLLFGRIIGQVSFLCSLLFCHELGSRIGVPCSTVFLDKTCIHQTDADLQREGIIHLAAFLRYSKNMLVCYSDIYLTKLWTVYEVASFFMVRPGTNICMVPVLFPKMVLFAATAITAVNLVVFIVEMYMTWEDDTLLEMLEPLIELCLIVTFSVLLRKQAREQSEISSQIQRFRVGHALCFVESDRKIVQENITVLLKGAGLIAGHANEIEALKLFDSMVRNMPHKFLDSLGCSGIPYKYIIVMTLQEAFSGLDQIGIGIRHDIGLQKTCLNASHYILRCLADLPVCLFLVAWLVRHCLHLTGMSEMCFLALCCFVTGVFQISSQGLIHEAIANDMVLVFIAWKVILVTLTISLYGFRGRMPRRSQSNNAKTNESAGLAAADHLEVPPINPASIVNSVQEGDASQKPIEICL